MTGRLHDGHEARGIGDHGSNLGGQIASVESPRAALGDGLPEGIEDALVSALGRVTVISLDSGLEGINKI